MDILINEASDDLSASFGKTISTSKIIDLAINGSFSLIWKINNETVKLTETDLIGFYSEEIGEMPEDGFFVPKSKYNNLNHELNNPLRYKGNKIFVSFDDLYVNKKDIDDVKSNNLNITNHPSNPPTNKQYITPPNQHTSELLTYLNELIEEFWIDYDPDNLPTNDAIMAWLATRDERFRTKGDINTPNLLSKYMAMISRPDKYKNS